MIITVYAHKSPKMISQIIWQQLSCRFRLNAWRSQQAKRNFLGLIHSWVICVLSWMLVSAVLCASYLHIYIYIYLTFLVNKKRKKKKKCNKNDKRLRQFQIFFLLTSVELPFLWLFVMRLLREDGCCASSPSKKLIWKVSFRLAA